MHLDPSHAALLITDPQDDLGPHDTAWGVAGRGVERATSAPNIERLLEAARRVGMVVAVAPHYCEPSGRRWGFGSILPECRPYLLGSRTIIAAPHGLTRREDHGLVAELRGYGIAQIVLVGTWANLCVEGYLRGLLARGFEVAVVGNATAAAIADALRGAPAAA